MNRTSENQEDVSAVRSTEITIISWLGNDADPEDLDAEIRISMNGRILTAAYDRIENEHRNFARVSASRLAYWFLRNWWLHRYDASPLPLGHGIDVLNWEYAHRLAAIGDGYVWPPFQFGPGDGGVSIVRPYPPEENKRVLTYETDITEPIIVRYTDFDRAIDEFVGGVITRISELRLVDTGLPEMRDDVTIDRTNPEYNDFRINEAKDGRWPDQDEE